MLGRVLFAVVCLIIAAGLLLPIYPAELEVARPVAAGAQDMLITDAGAPGCLVEATARAAVPADACIRLTVYLVVAPLPAPGPAGEPQLLPPKLPTI